MKISYTITHVNLDHVMMGIITSCLKILVVISRPGFGDWCGFIEYCSHIVHFFSLFLDI
jgi:hypothetical protein